MRPVAALPIAALVGLLAAAVFAAGPDVRLLSLSAGPVLLPLLAAAALWLVWQRHQRSVDTLVLVLLITAAALAAVRWAHDSLAGEAQLGFWAFVLGLWALAWRAVDGLASIEVGHKGLQRLLGLLVPCVFGLWLLFLWEVAVIGFGVPQVLLPPPSMIFAKMVGAADVLWADFWQTFVKAVLSGYVMGCGAGFLAAILVDRVPFLQRGLLPLGNLVSALPIVGIAPIMVMWFGFDWQSKAAVVVIMTFFPMLVNCVTGLAATDAMERELMQTYGASYWQTLVKVRLPAALPFIFNALKINSTLALIGAIVAEFFGTPIVGMGFRISTEVGRLAVDMVWAEIVVAAIAGSAFYGVMALLERFYTFWHPSFRQRR